VGARCQFLIAPRRLNLFTLTGSSDWAARSGRGSSYASWMLGQLQNRRGEPNLRTRLLAALVIVGLLVLTAPLIVPPIVQWLARVL
jgi:hypothetical protein